MNTEEASLARPPLTSCCATRFPTGHGLGPSVVQGQGTSALDIGAILLLCPLIRQLNSRRGDLLCVWEPSPWVMDEQDFPGVSGESSLAQKGQGERRGRQSPPGITCPTGLSRVDVVSLPRCQDHTQTPASPSTQQGSACSVLSSPRVPDSLQGHSPGHLQCLSSRTRLHLGTPWELRNPEVYWSPAKPPAGGSRSLTGGRGVPLPESASVQQARPPHRHGAPRGQQGPRQHVGP